MTINRHNYEALVVDYLDGKLSPSVVDELLIFLDKNPDVKEELDGLDDAILVSDTIVFPNKSTLKKKSFLKNGIDNEFEYLCIASVEGTITKSELSSLNKRLTDNNDGQNELQIFKKSSIEIDKTITFPYKSQLKRTRIIPIRYSTLRRTIAIAASITLLTGIYTVGKFFVLNNSMDDVTKDNIVASSNPPARVSEKENASKTKTYNEIKPLKIISNKETVSEPIKGSLEPEFLIATKPETLPNKIARLEPKEITIICDPQFQQLELIASTYPTYYHFSIEHYYAQQPNIKASKTREFGVFEIIQYGVQSFGNLIGKDFRLSAKKDKNGKIEKISFESKLVAFSTPVKRKE